MKIIFTTVIWNLKTYRRSVYLVAFALKSLKKIKYLQSKKDKIFQCTIEGFSKKMIHLNINEVDFTAFIYKSHLKPDRYRVARNKHALVGQFSKKVFRVGDNLKAGVKDIDILNQEVFLYIC